ncbi:MAG TPA: hypothetical protein VI382_08710 [Candidatus Manganitrophaceae bacterium]|nr:hypothetical protein [Candidatus Manganitrophaceae bacterium]
MKTAWRDVGLIWSVILFMGCAASPVASSPIEQRQETEFAAPEFSRESLQKGGLALLAILSEGAPEGVRQNAAYEIFQGLRASFPETRVIPRSDAVEKIVSSDKEAEYRSFVKNYEERRSMDPGQLKQWGDLEGVRYLLIGRVHAMDKRTEARMTPEGERSVGGKISVFSSGPNMIPDEIQKRVSLQGEIWDSLCGKAVWIGKSVAEATETSGRERVRVEDIFILAGRNLSKALAGALDKNSGPVKSCL